MQMQTSLVQIFLFCLIFSTISFGFRGSHISEKSGFGQEGRDNISSLEVAEERSIIRFSRCQRPPLIDHGRVNLGASKLGATRVVVCDPAYILVGPNLIVCTSRGWTRPGKCRSISKRFYLIKETTNWYDAVVRCASSAARLAMPRTSIDNAVIIHILNHQNQEFAWFGLNRVGTGSDKWQWLDGTPLDPDGFTNWLPNEPNNPDERCALFHLVFHKNRHLDTDNPQLYGWNDYYCAYNQTRLVFGRSERIAKIGAICERTLIPGQGIGQRSSFSLNRDAGDDDAIFP